MIILERMEQTQKHRKFKLSTQGKQFHLCTVQNPVSYDILMIK